MNEETKTIDKEFLDQMIARLKDQKKIHKKYVFRVWQKPAVDPPSITYYSEHQHPIF